MPKEPVRGDVRGVFEDAGGASEDSLRAALARFWVMADPLYLVDGNDRRSAHFARWTVTVLRERARNTFGISWGRDLEELTLRHGWEFGWERNRTIDLAAGVDVVGHKHPEGREFLPRADALRAPSVATAEELAVRKRRPRSLYAPEYAPLFLPIEGQSVVFPRGDRMVVVATVAVPEDTTVHSRHAHPRPWLDPPPGAVGAPDTVGLFLQSPSGRTPLSVRRPGSRAALLLEAPAGRWIASAEAFSPERRRAGRRRWGVALDTLPPDLPTLSGLLFVGSGSQEPSTLGEVLPDALPAAEIRTGDGVGVVWEVTGLGFGATSLAYRLSLTKRDGNVARKVGRWLGLVDDARALELAWEEAGPDHPTVVLRRVDVRSADLAEGTYDVTVEIRVPGRNLLRSTATLRVRGRGEHPQESLVGAR